MLGIYKYNKHRY